MFLIYFGFQSKLKTTIYYLQNTFWGGQFMCQQKIILPYSDAQHDIVLMSICAWLQLLVCIQKRSFTHTFVHVCSCARFVAAVPAVITNSIFLCHVGPIQDKALYYYDPVMVIWNFFWHPANTSKKYQNLII